MVSYRDVVCLECGTRKLQPTSTRGKYCSLKCQQKHKIRERSSRWMSGEPVLDNRALRRIISFLRGYKCGVCEISEWRGSPITLEVEHRNGDSSDCSPENVCLICPNCHSQTPTYKGANRGNGRHSRRQRYAEGKSY